MIHPQAQALLKMLAERGVPALHTLEPQQAREQYRQRAGLTQPPKPAVQHWEDLSMPNGAHGVLTLRLYRPLGVISGHPLPSLVFFHGGGWTIGDLDTHDTLCRELANGAGCAVVSVDYRMGPEHPFPAAVDDCLAATRWVRTNAQALGIDASRIAVGGDSAGGNLAAVVCLALRDASETLPVYQLLIYPATDMRRGAPSHTDNGQGYLLTRDTMTFFHRHYMGSSAQDADWRASPLLHSSHAGLPPALVLTAGFDPLRDEGLQYAHRLTDAGVSVSHVCFERQIHGFILMGGVLDEARTAVTLCAAELRRALA